ncbi:hypothetical protein LTR10_009487 [Elasticomyces elasticus]|nr:hypothetical protein LTR10_009487 [Elasticomyces elasticus]KAK4971415.1 hypothetical protein LTR42_007143 [Elasticomyces elasticus]
MASTPVSSKKRKAAEETTLQHGVRGRLAEAPKTGTRTVAVHVGDGTRMKTFDVYQDVVVRHSEFFKAALKPETWKEGQERSVSLPEDHAKYFEIFFHFLNSGRVFSDRDDYNTETKVDYEWFQLINCWALGHKLLSTSFRDAVLDAITTKMMDDNRWCLDLYRESFKKSTPSPKFRCLLADIVVYMYTDEDWKDCEDIVKFPEHLLDVAKAFDKIKVSGRSATAPWTNNDCTYHEHVADGTPCYKTLF